MLHARALMTLLVCLVLPACGESGEPPVASAANAAQQAGDQFSHPLLDVTRERLDAYVTVLQATAAGTPELDAAREHGWNYLEFKTLDRVVGLMQRHGGFEGLMAYTQSKLQQVNQHIGTLPEDQQQMRDRMRQSKSNFEAILAHKADLRPGGELVEGRLAEIRALRGD